MLAEPAQSGADTLDQALLLASVRQGGRPAPGTKSATARNAIPGHCSPRSGSSSRGAGFSVFEGPLALRRTGSHDCGLTLSQLTGSSVWDGSASIGMPEHLIVAARV